ncbi:murein L,D-transpeptidase catalytic domain family protein [Algoriphagus mannitolivorans]|uniref:murein L,D-transpeptidase catalytic domain family protein n=1 Tax=Algoriphagus mannitolivorans TaxID=226504 RepID=UPI000479517E|nr:murein L,D-transpeptidase catalytic domain family protein [Algoriphagus mannitolivorans]
MNLGISLFLIWSLLFSSPTPSTELTTEIKSESEILIEVLESKYSELPSLEALEMALEGYEKLNAKIKNEVLTVIDFSLPSTAKRMWVIDPLNGEILLHTVVAHGRNSGGLMAEKFSNTPESYQSSIGFYMTAETYHGKHGYSLRLDGLEKGYNDMARARAIVIHGADYATEAFAKSVGRLGRSLGCPALPSDLSKEAIDLIKDGSLLFIFGKDQNYLEKSSLIKA